MLNFTVRGKIDQTVIPLHDVILLAGRSTYPLSIVLGFDDDRFRTFGLRLICFGCRSVLLPGVRVDVERTLTDRLVDEGTSGLTLGQALQTVVSSEGRPDVEGLLADYRSYLSDRILRVTEFRSKHLSIS
jgi:exodeoxyribonuclease I